MGSPPVSRKRTRWGGQRDGCWAWIPSMKLTFVTALDTGPRNNSFNTANTQTGEEACHHMKETQITHNSNSNNNTVSRY